MAKIFWDVAQYIRKHGWCQGETHKGKAVCPVGAYYELRPFDKLIGRLKFSDDFERFVGEDIVPWNDVPGRTKRQVITKLEEIAWKLADEQGG